MNFYFLIFLGFLLSFCTQKNVTKQEKLYLKEDKKIIFHVDSTTTTQPRFSIGYYDEELGNDYYVVMNSPKPSIQFYNVTTQQMEIEVPLAKEGENDAGDNFDFMSFYIKSPDSIYLINRFYINILLANRHGKIQKKIAVPLLDKNGKEIDNMEINPMPHFSPFLHKNKLGLFRRVFTNNPHKIEPLYRNKSLIQSYNILTGEFDSAYYSLKSDKKDKLLGGNRDIDISSCYTNGKLIISYPLDNKIQVWDIDKNIHSEYDAKSNYFEDVEDFSESEILKNNYWGGIDKVVHTYHYSTIIYDQYRKLFYRFVYHPAQNPDALMEKYKQYSREPLEKVNFSIIILNENFQKMGESEIFDGNKYLTSNIDRAFFVAKEGLYISNNDFANNPEAEEDKFTFTLFKLVKNEVSQ